MKPLPSSLLVFSAFSLNFPAFVVAADTPRPIDFARDVQPIFAKHCQSCHGTARQKAGLRLDRRADALKGGESGPSFIPGQSKKSLLLQLVTGQDKDRVMPPEGDRLSAAEIALLQSWIDQGAKWPDDGSATLKPADWWSFQQIRNPPIPTFVGNPRQSQWVRNPIDAFVLAKLNEKGLQPSAEADPRTLIRRVYFDLIGLPPGPETIDALVKEFTPERYEKWIDTLLASPQYGERWGRHWLDVVHFGETHGYDKDQPRPNAWPYRDYVIRAFNSDKPYARFIQEQIAGDLLFPGTVDGIEALGFLAAGPWDFIGHVEVPESKIDGKIARHLDRDDFVSTTMGTFMGLTVHCAQCHNHKFDPISQEDYYRLQAVFAAIDRTDKSYDADEQIARRRTDLDKRKKIASARIDSLEAEVRAKAGAELARLDQEIEQARKPVNPPLRPEYGYHSGIADKPNSLKWVQIDLGTSIALDKIILRPAQDDFNQIGAGFGFPVRFKVELSDDEQFRTKVLVILDETAKDFPNPGTTAVVAKVAGQSGRYVRVTATQLAPRLANDFIFALAEVEARDTTGKNRAAASIISALDSIEAPVRWRKTNLVDGIYPPEPKLSPEALANRIERRKAILKSVLGEVALAEWDRQRTELTTVDLELGKLAGARRVAYIGAIHTGGGAFAGTGSTGGKPRPIYILPRGDVTKPGKEVEPGALQTIPGISGKFTLPANHTEGERRAALARWLSDPGNPLTWRVMANRVWQYHFGRGLVDSPNDFGKMGQIPTHPELLDWLSADLRDHQSIKRLHKQILMSATYRQVSTSNPIAAKIDGDNQYLWRQNRRKLEAEAVRDSILAVAGKLDLRMGGPSFQDFVVERPEHSPHYQYHLHDPENPKAHRRSVYRFAVRSKQQPFLAALDCADPSLAVEKRNQTLTPQQALALLNNPLALAMAKHFATRIEKAAPTDAGRIGYAIRLALGREATEPELKALVAYAREHGLANACRVILNLDEFVFID